MAQVNTVRRAFGLTRQRLFQIVDQVIDVFQADGQANQSGADIGGEFFFGLHSAVCGCPRVGNG